MPAKREKGSVAILAMFAVIMAGLFAGVYLLRHTLSCFVLAFVLSYLFDPFVVYLERKRVKRVYGIVILYAILTVFSIFCVAYIVPFLTLRWQELVNDLPHYAERVKAIALQLKGQYRGEYGVEELQWLYDTANKNIEKVLANIGAGVYATASRMAFNLMNLLLAPILVFFMLFYKKDIIEAAVAWIPADRREAILDIGRDINRSMGGFIRGQLVVSIIVAVLVTGALFFLGVDYPIFNGLFAGAASVLPFIGVILGALPPLFFAYVKYQNGLILLKVIASFSVIYFLEGYLVKPIVFRESMDLNPLATILVVMALGELMGFWGIILAIPIAAAMKILTEHFRRGDFADKPGGSI